MRVQEISGKDVRNVKPAFEGGRGVQGVQGCLRGGGSK